MKAFLHDLNTLLIEKGVEVFMHRRDGYTAKLEPDDSNWMMLEHALMEEDGTITYMSYTLNLRYNYPMDPDIQLIITPEMLLGMAISAI